MESNVSRHVMASFGTCRQYERMAGNQFSLKSNRPLLPPNCLLRQKISYMGAGFIRPVSVELLLLKLAEPDGMTIEFHRQL